MNAIADKNWKIYSGDDVVDMSTHGHLMKYPFGVDNKGQLDVYPGHDIIPDTEGAKFVGVEQLFVPDILTL